MKAFPIFIVAILLSIGSPADSTRNSSKHFQQNDEASIASRPEPYSGAVVCEPGIYLVAPDNCVPLGPAEEITQAAEEGIPYPILSLPAYPPDPALAEIPYQYFKWLREDLALRIFPTLEDAESDTGYDRVVGPGDLFVSYVGRVENEKGIFYHLRSGAWVRSDFGARFALHKRFQGLLFSSTPRYSFGWTLAELQPFKSPSYNAEKSERTLNRYDVVQVYATQENEGTTWVLIGPDEWLDYRHVARVIPRSTPPDGINTNRWIEVNLDEQTLAVYQDNQLLFATVISSGTGAWATRPGIFQIYEIKDVETMSGAGEADRSDFYYLEDVPWTMYFDEKRALHGAYWHDNFGFQRSHGCVNLTIGDAHWLYDWAQMGDYVYVFGVPSP